MQALAVEIAEKNSWAKKLSSSQFEIALNNITALLQITRNEEELSLVKDIIDKIEIVRDYIGLLDKSLIEQKELRNFIEERTIIAPILKLDKDGNPKIEDYNSSEAICYELATLVSTYNIKTLQKRILDSKMRNRKVVFVDDISGTGSQVDAYFNYLGHAFFRENQCRFHGLCMTNAAMKRIAAYCPVTSSMSVQAYFTFGNPINKINEIYEGYAAQVSISNQFRFGYNKSSLTLVLKRTPNNTLEIIWARDKVGGGPWPAPFPR